MKILITDPLAEEGINILRAYADVDIRLGLKPKELQSVIGDYEALVVRSETSVTAEVIEAGKRLQAIGRAGVGVDNIDLDVATSRGIVVVNAPESNILSAAEHTIALMLALARNIPQAHTHLKSGKWERKRFIGIEVRNKKLGIIGLGRVGSEVARRAKGMEMHLTAYDPMVSMDYASNLGVELVSLERLLEESDFITLHIPLTEATRGLIGARELMLVKPAVRIINTARGGIIDEEALMAAIEEGRVAGAAIDVFTHEPATQSILLKSDKIIVTPHLGASTIEAQSGVAVDIAEQVIDILQGKPAKYAVNMPLISADILPFLTPFMLTASLVGRLLAQLAEGQLSAIIIKYEGEIADHGTDALKAAVIGGFLESTTDERVNLVNANVIARRRGLKVIEQRSTACENYGNLITAEITTSRGTVTASGTILRGEPHIVRVNEYWIDIVSTGGYWLFAHHLDRPGMIGAVGMITGEADINISSMYVARQKPRGRAFMVLALDEPVSEEQRQRLLAIPDLYSAKVVKL
ncbi:MAG: phosphoglycerate dehydrogenase [Dehalococcoidia bacterium]|nr:D-3-phosphoglycerate dehydrogenase [Chloroflexota bacterium]MBT9161814.1 D-3-phosphoglycerate dehydrogenase [Chloroflexota bacterium]